MDLFLSQTLRTMTVADRYRLYAAECERAAAKSALAHDRLTFTEMADRWRRLAEEAEGPTRPAEPRGFARRPC